MLPLSMVATRMIASLSFLAIGHHCPEMNSPLADAVHFQQFKLIHRRVRSENDTEQIYGGDEPDIIPTLCTA